MWWAFSCERVDRLLVWAAGLFGNTKGRMLWTLHFVSMVVQIEYPAAPISSSRKSESNVPRGETALSRLDLSTSDGTGNSDYSGKRILPVLNKENSFGAFRSFRLKFHPKCHLTTFGFDHNRFTSFNGQT